MIADDIVICDENKEQVSANLQIGPKKRSERQGWKWLVVKAEDLQEFQKKVDSAAAVGEMWLG